ncbi:CPBP family intramembrane glutamic endopeptidase [Nonomuraea mesophila]|uniref:CPBP family intramembrane glutamic endopeptidase n=1 Tax=Nonomuraea mesophila TaxID=2530382 RepID=UPI001C707EBC|nr:type II CAAX endopeptidase family protein [Nonomuraea mesophila]
MRNKLSYAVLGGGLALIAGSALWLVLTGAADIRYSADHGDTVPMWHRWIPVLAGLALVRLVPPRTEPSGGVTGGRGVRVQAGVLLVAALVFAVALRWSGGGEPTHTVLKLALLSAVPAVLFRWSRRDPVTLVREPLTAWRRYGPAAPVAAWLVLSYAGPLALPASDFAATVDPLTLVVTVVVVFVVNALLEEVFYRRWLQTRWEHLLGPWPAIVLSSLLWASWHIGIQGTGDLPRDLASAFVNQGVQGLFLGYLWSRYRLMWPLLVVHGAVNAAPILLGML